MQVTCIKCNKHGSLSLNHYKSNGRVYKYYGVQHYDSETKKLNWCYLGKYDSLPDQHKAVIHKKQSSYTKYTQTNRISETFNACVFSENQDENVVARRRFELLSWGPKPQMPSQRIIVFDRYTTGLFANWIERSVFYRLCMERSNDVVNDGSGSTEVCLKELLS